MAAEAAADHPRRRADAAPERDGLRDLATDTSKSPRSEACDATSSAAELLEVAGASAPRRPPGRAAFAAADVPDAGVERGGIRCPVSATIIDGKAIAADVRAQVARDVAAFTRAPRARARPGDDPRRRGPGERGVRRRQAEGLAPRSGSPASATTCPRDASRAQVVALIEELNADPAVSGILCQLPVPGPPRRRRADRPRRPRQGRRRPHADQRRAPRARRARAAALHARGRR